MSLPHSQALLVEKKNIDRDQDCKCAEDAALGPEPLWTAREERREGDITTNPIMVDQGSQGGLNTKHFYIV